MAVCAVTRCRNTCKKDLNMVRFPKDVNLRERWLLLLRRSDWKPNENSLLCETYFERDQWTKTRYRLKDCAVPTLFCTCCCENSCDQRGTSSNEADHIYSKHGFDCAGSSSIQQSDGNCIDMKSRPKLHEAHDSLLSKKCRYRKKNSSKNSPCNRGHSNLCVMSNSINNDQTGNLYSSEKERIFYELLEEHVALKSELGRLTRAYESTFRDDH